MSGLKKMMHPQEVQRVIEGFEGGKFYPITGKITKEQAMCIASELYCRNAVDKKKKRFADRYWRKQVRKNIIQG